MRGPCREGFPDSAAPPKLREKAPYADLAVTLFHSGANATDQQLVQLLIIWQSKAAAMGKWGQPKDFMYIASFILQAGVLDRELTLSPVLVLEVVLALDLSEGGAAVLQPVVLLPCATGCACKGAAICGGFCGAAATVRQQLEHGLSVGGRP